MKNIAYVCADAGIPVFGTKGASIHVQSIVRALIKQGHRVTLFASRFDGPVPPGLDTVCCVPLPAIPKGMAEERAMACLRSNDDTCRLLDAHGPFDLVYERYSLWSDAGMRWADAQGVPGLLEVNAPLIDEQRTHRTLVMPEKAEEIARSVFNLATALLPVSPAVGAYLEGWTGDSSRIHVIANGVDPDRFAHCATDRAQQGLEGRTCVVGFVGTLKPWHGLPLLVDAFALLHRQRPEARLLVVGDGPCRTEIEESLAQRKLSDYCHFSGAVQADDVPDLLTQMDIATAPYPSQQDFYFSPLKIYEYLAAELPVVTTRVGHLDSVVMDGVDGMLVAPDDPQALADALMQLVDDPARRRQMGHAGRERIIAGHSWDAVVERFLSIADQAKKQH
ncbi:MAG: glycosyltransferase family 4 protein [Lautropia sp.]|nr:glycosyltransferase family 4 protein [Lautropia sp.]